MADDFDLGAEPTPKKNNKQSTEEVLPVEEVKATEEVKNTEETSGFYKQSILSNPSLSSSNFAILNSVLEDNKKYTEQEVEQLISNFKNKRIGG